jgi:hypothetical protein
VLGARSFERALACWTGESHCCWNIAKVAALEKSGENWYK